MSTPSMSICIIYRERVTSRRLEPGSLEAVGEGATGKAKTWGSRCDLGTESI